MGVANGNTAWSHEVSPEGAVLMEWVWSRLRVNQIARASPIPSAVMGRETCLEEGRGICTEVKSMELSQSQQALLLCVLIKQLTPRKIICFENNYNYRLTLSILILIVTTVLQPKRVDFYRSIEADSRKFNCHNVMKLAIKSSKQSAHFWMSEVEG